MQPFTAPVGQRQETTATYILKLRCPKCRKLGTFQAIIQKDVLFMERPNYAQGVVLGSRCCPNDDCNAHVFFAAESKPSGKLLCTFPPERIDFDSTNLPPNVTTCLQEAISCHSVQCFTASAIMVRKTLEELCEDRKAIGKSLKDRLAALSGKIIVPPELLKGLDTLRLLGNDAAHIELKDFDSIGKDELDLAIEVTKEVLKAVYQYDSLISKLNALRR